MNEWQRRREFEDPFEEMHHIRPEIYRLFIDKDMYRIKLVKDGKEVVLTEVMCEGLTLAAYYEYKGNIESAKTFLDAEKAAVAILRGT